MLDFDLAELYQTETKRLKESVRRNSRRFPPDFMFELTKSEVVNLRTQNASSSWGGSRYLPFAFTEHGITMLSAVLNSDVAIEMNIAIVRAFIALKQFAAEQKEVRDQLEKLRQDVYLKLDVHDAQLSQIYEAIENMLDVEQDKKLKQLEWENRDKIGFKKQ